MQDAALGFGNIVVDLVIAAACGAAIGLERQMQKKPAGLRTNMMIALGSALFTTCSIGLAGDISERARIASNIVVGIGFLGAGTIVRHGRDAISGLTTAATVWVVAALGMAAGEGFYLLAISGTVIALAILSVLERVEYWIEVYYIKREMHLVTEEIEDEVNEVRRMFVRYGFHIENMRSKVRGEKKLHIYVMYGGRASKRKALLDAVDSNPRLKRVSDISV